MKARQAQGHTLDVKRCSHDDEVACSQIQDMKVRWGRASGVGMR